ncbi:MAG: hypothetical protein HOI95_01090 [Chromatiales bacterium]|jgi:hypothetical protein|nr:hypothetical protein [Chromatiales bacterium]
MMKKALILGPLAMIVGGATYLFDNDAVMAGSNSEMSAMVLAVLVVLPLISGWLEA